MNFKDHENFEYFIPIPDQKSSNRETMGKAGNPFLTNIVGSHRDNSIYVEFQPTIIAG